MPTTRPAHVATRKATAARLDASCQFALAAFSADSATDGIDTKYSRIPMLPVQGAIGRDGRGPFTYNVATVTANMRANAQNIPVFLDHQPGRAFGWGDYTADLIPMPDGTWELPVTYTDEGLAAVQSKAFDYNSPTWLFIQDPTITDRQAGEIVGFLEVSLTNLPNQYLRSLNSQGAAAAATYTVDIPLTAAEQAQMTAEQLAALGLAADAAPEAILAAITALVATAAMTAAIVEASGAAADADAPAIVEAVAQSRITSGAVVTKQAYDAAVTATTTAQAAQATAEQARTVAEQALASFHTSAQAAAVNAAVDTAITAGKFTPAMRESLHTLATKDLVAFSALAAATRQHAAIAPLATPAVTDETFGLTADQLATCKAQGIKPEILAKNLRTA